MKELWHASLDKTSPRYEQWKHILGQDDHVPLVRPFSTHADLGPEKDVEIYLLDWQNLDEDQSNKLLEMLSEKFKASTETIAEELDADGYFPIRAADVFIAFDLRAFI